MQIAVPHSACRCLPPPTHTYTPTYLQAPSHLCNYNCWCTLALWYSIAASHFGFMCCAAFPLLQAQYEHVRLRTSNNNTYEMVREDANIGSQVKQQSSCIDFHALSLCAVQEHPAFYVSTRRHVPVLSRAVKCCWGLCKAVTVTGVFRAAMLSPFLRLLAQGSHVQRFGQIKTMELEHVADFIGFPTRGETAGAAQMPPC